MGELSSRKKNKKYKGDPVVDQLRVIDARTRLMTSLVSMGWRLALMVLVPIFIGVELDKKFDSTPSITLAAFFIAIFGASLLIYNTYSEMHAAQERKDARKARRAARRAKRLERRERRRRRKDA